MALEMRDRCERCGEALSASGEANIRGYECSFWRPCYDALQASWPSCGGELVRQPRRTGAG